MNKVHHKLKLQHHKHTGKLLHHRHTSYRALAVVFGFAALAIVGLNVVNRATADSLINVYGTVPVPVPGSAAIITLPEDGSTLEHAQTMVAGTCPLITPQVVVGIELDGASVGSAVCDSNNDFSLPLSLSVGSHSLVARTYTITGQKGPGSSTVRFAYTPAAAPADTNPNKLTITADNPFTYPGFSRIATWTGSFGGNQPHSLRIDWGDGSYDDYRVQAGAQRFSHHYAATQPYNTTFTLADAAGNTLHEQFAVAAYRSAGNTAAGFASVTGGHSSAGTSTVIGLYGLFLTCLSVCGIVWLEARHAAGEHAAVPVTGGKS